MHMNSQHSPLVYCMYAHICITITALCFGRRSTTAQYSARGVSGFFISALSRCGHAIATDSPPNSVVVCRLCRVVVAVAVVIPVCRAARDISLMLESEPPIMNAFIGRISLRLSHFRCFSLSGAQHRHPPESTTQGEPPHQRR